MPVSANFIATWSLKTHWPAYLKGSEAAGIKADPDQWHVARSVYVADSDDEAEQFVKEPGGAYDYYYDYLYQILFHQLHAHRTNYLLLSNKFHLYHQTR